MDSTHENDLLAQAKDGDRHAFEQALLPYLAMLFAYSRAICGDYHAAQDVVQETALIAFRNLHHLFPEADFATWLRAIARRQALAARRKLTRVVLVAEDAIEKVYQDPAPVATGPRYDALAACLKILAGRMARVIRAHYFQGCTLEEVARSMAVNVSTVKQLLYRARLRLRECVQQRLSMERSE
jgi:RNA polymerase sigma-70 factor (ECF subfamily)